ncbi:hypothetical protein SARC_11616, partial [Sphaeroforma arctica JP610]
MSATVKENIPAPVAKADNVLSLRSASGGLDTDLTAAAVRQCTQSLTDDKVIAVPTDTIYGLATRAQSSLAVKKLYDIKGRNFFKPIAICVASVLDVQKYGDVSELPPGLLEKLLPGPVTVILRRTTTLNPDLNPYTNVVGIRVPDNDFVLQLMKSCDSEFGPLALTSANMAGEESAVCVTDFEKLWPKISSVVDGGKVGVAKTGSTIVDLSVRGRYRIVRDGSALQETTQTLEAHALTQIDGAESKLNAARAYEVALLDIEGTTTPITFVHDVLFPYAKDNVERLSSIVLLSTCLPVVCDELHGDTAIGPRKPREMSDNATAYNPTCLGAGAHTPVFTGTNTQANVIMPVHKRTSTTYLKANWTTADCQDVVQQLRVLATTDAESGIEGAVTIPPTPTDTTDEKNAELSEAETSCIECVVKSVRWLMSADRKVGPLKLLQGRIWTDAYATGEIKGAVYDDVVPVLAEWKANGVDAYIYSSGSIAAQKLLFQYSEKGDILPYF